MGLIDELLTEAGGETPAESSKRVARRRGEAKKALADAIDALGDESAAGALLREETPDPDEDDGDRDSRGVRAWSAEPVIRPNGTAYLPRRVADVLTDLELLEALRNAKPSIPVLLAGPPGTGKSALAEAHAVNCGSTCHTLNGHSDTEVADLVGRYVPVPGGGFVWRHGPLVKAMLEGAILFIDDATLIPAGVLARMYPVMDGRGCIFLEEHDGEEIVAAPGFHVVGAHNPGIAGAVLAEALSSRFTVQLEVGTDYALAMSLGVDKKLVRIAKRLAEVRDSGGGMWAPELREMLAFKALAEVAGVAIAASNLIACAPPEAREELEVLVRTAWPAAAPLALGEQA
jgi:hypothetical protein